MTHEKGREQKNDAMNIERKIKCRNWYITQQTRIIIDGKRSD